MSTSGLSAVAAWDVALLRNAVGTLDVVGERLLSWRARMEGVGRALGDPDRWSGPAATAAAGSLVRVSTVVADVTAALTRSLAEADLMVAAADTAARVAGEALAAARAVPVDLDDGGRPGPLPAVPLGPSGDPAVALGQQYDAVAEQAAAAGRAVELAGEALRSADRAALAGGDAVVALGRVGVVGGLAPADFPALVTTVGLAGAAPAAPLPADRAGVAHWWAAMSPEQRGRWIDGSPGLVGGLDGVPAWARDSANRLLLARVLLEPGASGHDVALATQTEILRREADGQVVQLYEFAPGDELVALSLGDLDTADHIGVIVPGTSTTPEDDLDAVVSDAAAVAAAGIAAAPGAAVAALAWIGYRTPPGVPEAARQDHARAGGPRLDATLDGLAASRTAGGAPAHTVVLAHSYGGQVVEEAADAPGVLAADDVVLLGSPGIEGAAADLEAGEVYSALGGSDPIRFVPLAGSALGGDLLLSWAVDSPVFGRPPWDPTYGATALPVDEGMGHSDYYDGDEPTLAAMGAVLVDER